MKQNLLVAGVWDPAAPRTPEQLERMSPGRQGAWHEWAVATELFRRPALAGSAEPERVPYWQGGEHELDFVAAPDHLVEVKRGRAAALEFAWFTKAFRKTRLTVVCSTPFQASQVRGVTLDEFLRGRVAE